MTTSRSGVPPPAFDVPTPARAYDYMLGGKNNFDVDRSLVHALLRRFPEALDVVRDNRQLLYRAIRFLARDAGISQFLDAGSGLPAQDNVYQVARRFQPDARVVYVDNEPTVLTHGRAMLATHENTTVIAADVTEPEQMFGHRQTQELLDFSQPLAVLFLSVGHFITEDDVLARTLAAMWHAVPPGSYLAFSQGVAATRDEAQELTALIGRHGVRMRTRLAPDIVELLREWEPVAPGLVDVRDWRPDPDQPPLPNVAAPLRAYLGASVEQRRAIEFGGVARRPE